MLWRKRKKCSKGHRYYGSECVQCLFGPKYTQEDLNAAVAGARWQAAHDILTENAMKTPTQEQSDHPWEFGETRSKERTVEIDITEGMVTVCRVIGSTDSLIDNFAGARQAHANARLILKSVNNHHRLVSALKDLLQAATLEHIDEAADALEAVGVTPILPGHCQECGELPCGQYMGCPDEPQPTDAKPESQEWVNGLPPVGCECELKHIITIFPPDDGTTRGSHSEIEWRPCRVVAHEHGQAIYITPERQVGIRKPDWFRPLKTDAEREKEEVIEAVYQVWNANAHLSAQGVLETLYDAGMLRKGGE